MEYLIDAEPCFATCPRCANKDAYVMRSEPAFQSQTADIIHCHCGKCGHMFQQLVERFREQAERAAASPAVL